MNDEKGLLTFGGMLLLVMTLSTTPFTPNLPESIVSCSNIDSQPASLLASAIIGAGLEPINLTEGSQGPVLNESNAQVAAQINQTIGFVDEYLHLNFTGLWPFRNDLQAVVTLVPQVQAYNNLVRDARAYPSNPNSACQLYVDAFVLGASAGMFDATDAATVLSVLGLESDLSSLEQLKNYCGACTCLQEAANILNNTAENYLSTSVSVAMNAAESLLLGNCEPIVVKAVSIAKQVPGVPEYPIQLATVSVFTLVVVTSYLIMRRHSTAKVRGS